MKRVISPLKLNDHGAEVANLQAALLLLIDRGRIALSLAEQQTFTRLLTQEQQDQAYKSTTVKAVSLFQQQQHLQPATGEVDAPTAEALNQVLKELGAFDTPRNGHQMVAGQVVQDDRAPFMARMILFHEGGQGSIHLGEDATDPEGRYSIGYDSALGLDGTKLRVAAFDSDGKQRADATITDARPIEIVNLIVLREAPAYRVEGRVASRSRAGVGGLRVQIVDKNVGADVPLAAVATADDGSYRAAFPYAGPKQKPDLQARVLSGEKFLGASEVRYNASNAETLNVALLDKANAALASEHDTLTGVLSAHVQGNLRELQETGERQDITYLANKTGWDARAVALAALSDQFSARIVSATGAAPAIPPALFYALFRAGLPANEAALYATDAQAAGEIWKQAIAQGLIPAALEARLPAAVAAFQKQVARQALEGPPSFGLSPLKTMLAVSLGVDPDPRAQREKEERFADLYTRHRNDQDVFWREVRETFGEPVEQRLRLDGQLAFLTLNNAPLVSKLRASAGPDGLSGLQDLVASGYYHPEKWQEAIGADSVPPEIPGQDEAEKQRRYAELLAAQVSLSFPTLTVAQMVLNKDTRLFNHDGTEIPEDTVKGIGAFLTKHHGQFELGVQPVEQYVRRNNAEITPEVSKEITRIQRVFQITPGNQAMSALLNRNVDSAYKVVQYGQEDFVRAFRDEVGGEANARLIHARAQQVHNTALNIAVAYLNQYRAPGIGMRSTAQIINPALAGSASPASDVLAYPTLESLLGGLDFCACEDCRSMLSPAAYLVDLLHFLDRDNSAWESFLANWKSDHGDAPYPFASLTDWNAAEQPLDTEIAPLQVLLARRPDIQHLPLTCENTNTPLPYIDLVNETLEHFVASGSLAGYTGHTTDGSASAEELLANPQFVADAAYTILGEAHFPPPLPFHQPLETLRRYFDRFEAPLPEVMEALRKDDSLERASDETYGWRDILMEALRLSRAEYRLLTNRDLTLQALYGFPPGEPPGDVVAELSHARTFARRVGVCYEELVEILKTQFINPASTLIPRFERLGVSFDTLKKFIGGQITPEQFEQALAPQLDASQYGGDIKAWVAANSASIMNLITLTNPNAWLSRKLIEVGVPLDRLKALKDGAITDVEFEAGLPDGLDDAQFGGDVAQWVRDHFTVAGDDCSFEALEFRYADPDKIAEPVRAIEFIRLLRFIRLWKKLGWTIAHTDKAIAALYPADQIADESDDQAAGLQKLDTGFLALLPRLGVLRRVMKALKLKPQTNLLPLLALFAPIDTHGESSLYRRMFLSPALAKQDPVFADDGSGSFLKDEDQKLAAHAEMLRAAFALTAEELDLITAALNFDADTPLTLENISAVFRRGWLARALKLSVREFLLLTQFAGLDPFALPNPADPPVLRLIELLQHLRAVSLKPAQALYLIWNQDISGKSAPEEDEILDFARVLRSALAAIESEFALADDPDGQIARARMALVYGSQATDLFFGLLNHTLISEVLYDHDQAALEQPILDAAPDQIAYDDFRKRLSFIGVMTETVRDNLKVATGATDGFKAAVVELFSQNKQVLGPFFARYPELLTLHDAYVASDELEEVKRRDLLEHFLPELKRRRKRQQATQAISAVGKTEVEFARAVLDAKPEFTAPPFDPKPEPVYVLRAGGDPDRPALDDLAATETPGLSAQFFFRATATGAVDLHREAEGNLAYAPGSNRLPENTSSPGSPISGVWSGSLEAPEDDFYNFLIETEPGAVVSLTLNGKSVDLDQDGNVRSNREPLALRAGTLYPITLRVENVQAELSVRWETRGRGREIIPARFLYPATGIDALRQVYVRFLKAASLTAALKLAADELAYLAAHPQYRIDAQGWLNHLPVTGSPDPQVSAGLLVALGTLLDFARFKAALGSEDRRLLSVLQDPAAAAQEPQGPLFSLTRWDPASLATLLGQFGKSRNDLADLAVFRRVSEAFAWVRQMGVPAAALITATTNEPVADTVRALQSALRARYQERDWLKVLQPINDELRALQRDALVAHTLQGMHLAPATAHIDTPEKLFEFFLMDVQMEPCMQTSRIRHALSSVQLFIERGLMNIEPRVSPAVIPAKQWEWMSRYRVWEANRKVFLFPENWLEPELRDDQSPFFKETMSELLQSDITEDTATTALLNYLSKLEEVAKLEPCGIYYEEHDLGTEASDDVVHVVARTAGATRKYYYRCRKYGSWTPWEQIRLEIEDNPVIPVVWRGRLLLFWLRILQEPPLQATRPDALDVPERPLAEVSVGSILKVVPPTVTVKAVLCWSEYYNGKWQPARTSDVNRPTELGHFFNPAGAGSFDRSALRLQVFEGDNAGARKPLVVRILGQGDFGEVEASFTLYNTHGLPATEGRFNEIGREIRLLDTEGDTLTITYHRTTGIPLPGASPQNQLPRPVLRNRINDNTDSAIVPLHELRSPWDAPFFYADSRHAFFVTTTESIVMPPHWDGYTPGTLLENRVLQLPRLVQPELLIPPRPVPILDADGSRVPFGAVDPAVMRRFVTEDAYIRRAISTLGTVRFGEIEIGPAGGLLNGATRDSEDT